MNTTPMNSLNRDQYREVDEALDTLIDDDYWSYPEDTRSMIFTTKKIKDLFHSELEKVRQETIDIKKITYVRDALNRMFQRRKSPEDIASLDIDIVYLSGMLTEALSINKKEQ